MLWSRGQENDALQAMQTAARLSPEDAETRRNLGVTLIKLERFAEAERYLREALAIEPDSVAVYSDLANLYQLQGLYAEAQSCSLKSLSLRPEPDASGQDMRYSSLLFLRSHDPGVSTAELFAQHRRVGERFEAGYRSARPRHRNDPDPGRRLRVAFVSGDLCNHAVAHFIEPVLAELRRRPLLQLCAYYNNPLEDAVSQRLRGYFDEWHQSAPLSTVQFAKKIMDDGIDVLIDLSGHTSMNRLQALARKPAPVQASWIGYPGTTGLDAMDYYLADRFFLPPGRFDAQFTEKLVYLPANVPFKPHESSPEVNALPALASGNLTFGSFNRLGKLNAASIELWSGLLRALPGSRMVVGGLQRDQEPALTAKFEAFGIAAQRLSFLLRDRLDAYLAHHHRIDICLDTMPYSGGTTTFHALWMGVPTLTVAGATPAAMQGAAIMGQLGLTDFVATDAADFVAKGCHWAAHVGELARLRAGMRRRWESSPGRDPAVLAASLDEALRRMWRRWCAGLPPESFEVPATTD